MGQPLSPKQFEAITTMPKVKAALQERARLIAETAQRIAEAEAGEGEGVPKFTVETGVRPRGRGYARAISNDPDAEFGTWVTTRRRYLGRAAAQFPSAKKPRP